MTTLADPPITSLHGVHMPPFNVQPLHRYKVPYRSKAVADETNPANWPTLQVRAPNAGYAQRSVQTATGCAVGDAERLEG